MDFSVFLYAKDTKLFSKNKSFKILFDFKLNRNRLYTEKIYQNQKQEENEIGANIMTSTILGECKLRQLSKKLGNIKENTMNRVEIKLKKTYREIVTEVTE